jgi:hypothetical protein
LESFKKLHFFKLFQSLSKDSSTEEIKDDFQGWDDYLNKKPENFVNIVMAMDKFLFFKTKKEDGDKGTKADYSSRYDNYYIRKNIAMFLS